MKVEQLLNELYDASLVFIFVNFEIILALACFTTFPPIKPWIDKEILLATKFQISSLQWLLLRTKLMWKKMSMTPTNFSIDLRIFPHPNFLSWNPSKSEVNYDISSLNASKHTQSLGFIIIKYQPQEEKPFCFQISLVIILMAALSLVDPQTKADAAAAAAAGEDEYSIVHFNYDRDLSIGEIPTGNIYKQTLLSTFNFRKSYKIITMERNLTIKESKDIYLLSRDEIRNFRSKYQFLHIGLVQFAMVENLSSQMQALVCNENHPSLYVSIRLRDTKNLEDSVLVWFESTSIINARSTSAIKFNWFPCFSSSLFDLANSNGLVVSIDFPDSFDVEVRYKVCFKLMKKSLKPDYLFGNPVVEVNTEITNIVSSKSQQ
ncbi:hypothetical protein P8452_64322 [Trifolium repens]|nr:hypothetical protein P8452_64322 [Trifolium repens]